MSIAFRLLALLPLLHTSVFAQTAAESPARAPEEGELDWYLPDQVSYDPDCPKPAEVLGWEVGTWHVRHDQLVQWARTVAEASPRIQLETYGYTHEQRPLLLAAVSSPANLERLEEIRSAHLESVLTGKASDGPTVVWMGYGVHGNESSASNASLLLLYHLAAAQGDAMAQFLEKTVVLVDPCVNPDGLSRFAQWANMHRGKNLVADGAHRERREAWPGGRTNHYWFDLNRDWLLQTHPESQGRLAQFHRWLPCVLTDFHEMGSDSTYFFQPGIPSRRNPLTPEENVVLTGKIAEYHARALDAIGSLYYTEESFDDFYYGKGSTYPDVHGCIGILFEQASSRGHLRENSFGGISFPFTIRNQFTTSLSTLDAVAGMRDELESYQRRFFADALAEAKRHPVKAYVFGNPEDPGRTYRMADLLRRHNIRLYELGTDLDGTGDQPGFRAGEALAVPLDQPQFRLIRSLFERRTSWPDNTFYDVSSWSFPESFNLPARAIERMGEDLLGAAWDASGAPQGQVSDSSDAVAWAFGWSSYDAPHALQRLLAAGVRARVADMPFRARVAGGERSFQEGTILIPAGVQEVEEAELRALLQAAAADGVEVHAITSGLTPDGIDLGSGSLLALEDVKPVLVVGDGVSSGEAGEVWHYLDQRLDLPVALVDAGAFGRLDLARYTHVLLVNGASGALGKSTERLESWVRQGGVLVATKSSALWAADTYLSKADADGAAAQESGSETEAQSAGEERRSYADYGGLRAEQRIAGTIFRTELDLTHPLCFGFGSRSLPVFRNSESILPESRDPFATPVRYTAEPLISGFASGPNVEKIAGSPAVRAERLGSGVVICMVDNPNFRGVWYGTNKLYANALYFGGAIQRTGPLEVR